MTVKTTLSYTVVQGCW